MIYFFSPLEQFDSVFFFGFNFKEWISWFPFNVAFDFTNIIIVMIIFILFIIFLGFFFSKKFLIPTFSQFFLEFFYKFIYEMLTQQAGTSKVAVRYFPLMFFTFFFILFSNLFGMLPYGFTVTGHLFITFLIALSFNLGFIFKGFAENGLSFLNLFVPSGAPEALLPLIVVIEVVSYLIRTFSLSIRLFANMMAGHCLLFVVSSFVFSLIAASYFGLVALILVYLFIFILEFAIAFLQAYVFAILLCIYLQDSLSPGH